MIKNFLILFFCLTILIQNVLLQTTQLGNTTSSPPTTTLPSRTYSDGAYSLIWTESADYVDFVFTNAGQAEENTYSAFALSLDSNMVKKSKIHLH